MPDPLSIKNLINDISRGRIRIPSFQRGFVWEPEMVAYFIDSIYKGFPFGSILLWTTTNRLKREKNLGPYKLPQKAPEYQIDYVLDGQQRITSIFGIFQNELEAEANEDTTWTQLFFEINSQESIPFVYLDNPKNYDPNEHFPLKYVFGEEWMDLMEMGLDKTVRKKIKELVQIFLEVKIPIERFKSEEREYVATVFERINRKKVDLEVFDLLLVWNWSEDFDLRKEFQELSEEIEEIGFGQVNNDLLLSCCSAVLKNSAKPEVFVNIPGNELRIKFNEVKNGIFGAIDFLQTQFKVCSLKLLPRENILVVLSSFFASSQKQSSPLPGKQYKVIKQWFWRLCFSRAHKKGGVKITNKDLEEIKKLKEGKESKLADIDVDLLDENYFKENYFHMGNIATLTFILMLADSEPLNFIQGTKISLDSVLSLANRSEYHHIFPKAHLEKLGKYDKIQINCLANFCILSRTDNKQLGGRAPSDYRSEMPEDNEELNKILKSHFCFEEMFNDDYDAFLQKRAKLLVEKARELAGL